LLTVGLYGIPDTTSGAGPSFTHDHGVALMRDGRVVTVIELERYTGLKHDNRLPDYLLEILEPWLVPGEPVRFVSANSFVGDSFITRDGNLRIEPDHQPEVDPGLTPARCLWYPDGRKPRHAEAWVISHELAHVASVLPFYGGVEPDTLLVHVDGGASRSACSFWHWDGAALRCLHSAWGDLKDAVNNFNDNPLVCAILGEPPTAHLSTPGKLMGYAAWGRPDEALGRWLRERRWFLDHQEGGQELLTSLSQVRGEAMLGFDMRDPWLMNVAACIQRAFEDDVVAAIDHYARQTRARHLVYAGGAALNIPTNRRLHELGVFETIRIPPPASDAGLALGAAAWVEFAERGNLELCGPYLNRFALDGLEPEPTVDVEQVAGLIASGAAVGLCHGAAEVGPRALGHRSILARADQPALRQRVSETIKRREWYRPLAPMMRHAAAVEVLGREAADADISRYMLGAWTVREPWRERLAGVVHSDGTVRPQVVHPDDQDNRFLVQLLACLDQDHGLPAVINTSFNVRGQPIVQRRDEAIRSARSMGLDAVVLPDRVERL